MTIVIAIFRNAVEICFMVAKAFSFSFKVEQDGSLYHAWCPESGCHSHGKTKLMALENLKDTVQLYLDTIMEEEIARQLSEDEQTELSSNYSEN